MIALLSLPLSLFLYLELSPIMSKRIVTHDFLKEIDPSDTQYPRDE